MIRPSLFVTLAIFVAVVVVVFSVRALPDRTIANG